MVTRLISPLPPTYRYAPPVFRPNIRTVIIPSVSARYTLPAAALKYGAAMCSAQQRVHPYHWHQAPVSVLATY